MDRNNIKCPACNWTPPEGRHWNCLECGADLDHFNNLGRCNQCGYNHDKTYCPVEIGGCGQSSPHLDWYGNFEEGLSKINIFNR